MTTLSLGHLPDPVQHAEFYSGVATKRALAWLVDVILIAILCIVILPFTAFTGLFFFPFLMLTTGFLYRWFTIAGQSATWGMRLFNIELRDISGDRLTSSTALLHTLGYTFCVVTAPLQLISVVMMALTPRGQGITDHLLGTTAINRPA